MTRHKIMGSEAHRPSAHIQVRLGRPRRRMHPAIQIHMMAVGVGVVASVIDIVIGAPVCLTLVSFGFLILWLTPGS